MAKRGEVYKCELCGNIVEVLEGQKGALFCCGQPMKLFDEKTADASLEKHVPFVQKETGRVIVKIGENAAHPMEESHYIQWIEVVTPKAVMRRYLSPGDAPQARFELEDGLQITAVREYCNVHGLWKS